MRLCTSVVVVVIGLSPICTFASEFAKTRQSCQRVTTNFQMEAPDPSTQVMSAMDIRRKTGAENIGDVHGAYHRRGVAVVDPDGCVINVFMRLESTIFIAQESTHDRCVHQKVLDHEKGHFVIQKQAFMEAAQSMMRSDLVSRCLQLSTCDGQDLSMAISYKLTERMEQLAANAHAALDSPESHAAEMRGCQNAFIEAGNVIRQGKWFR